MATEAEATTIEDDRRGSQERCGVVDAAGETAGETSRARRHAGVAVARLCTVAGPDSARSLVLTPGAHVVGRAASVDLTLDDPTLALRQAILTVDAAGAVRVTDLSAPRPTRVDDVVADGSTAVRPGQPVTMGATTLVVAPMTPADGSGTAPSQGPVPDARVLAGAVPTADRPRWHGRRSRRAAAGAAQERFAAELAAHQLAVAGRLRRDALELPDAVRAATTGDRVWAAEGGAFAAVVGRGDRWQPPLVDNSRAVPDEWWAIVEAAAVLRDVPVAVDLGPGAVVGVVGPPALAWPVARSLVLQLAVAHGPAALAVTAILRPEAPERVWLAALPHARDDVLLGRHRVHVIDDRPPSFLGPSGAALVVAATAAVLPLPCDVVVDARADGSAVVRRSAGGDLGEHVAAAGASLRTAVAVGRALMARARSEPDHGPPGEYARHGGED